MIELSNLMRNKGREDGHMEKNKLFVE